MMFSLARRTYVASAAAPILRGGVTGRSFTMINGSRLPSSPMASSHVLVASRATRHQVIQTHKAIKTSTARRTFTNSRSISASPESVVYALVGTNVVVYMMWTTAETPKQRMRMMTHFTTSAQHLDNGMYHTLLTAVFSHASFSHLFANTLGLYFFGREISYVLGPKRFLGLYLASGVLSSWAAVQEQKLSRRTSLNLGASGAVNSITALSILLYPHSTLLIFGIVPIPAWIAGSMFIGRDFYQWINGTQDGIGHFAHLSGAACGAAYYAHLRRGMRMYR